MESLWNKPVGLLLMLLGFSLLGGCASTSTVHVFAKYLNDEEVTQVKQALEQSDYKVVINHYEFPTSVERSAVIYSPMHSNPKRVETLMALVDKRLGRKTDLIYLKSENHSYTKDNIGLYLFGDNQSRQSLLQREGIIAAGLDYTYSAQGCQTLAFGELTLELDGHFTLITAAENAPEQSQTGQWMVEKDYLVLKTQHRVLAGFIVSRSEQQAGTTIRQFIRLKPRGDMPHIDHCGFDYVVNLIKG